MKRVLFLLVTLLFVTFSFAQTDNIPVSAKTQKICFQRVIQTEGTNTEVFNRIAGEWLRSAYKNPQAVVFANDGSTISGKHLIQLTCGEEAKAHCPRVNYKFTVEVREGRVRYTITDFTLDTSKTTKGLYPIERWLNTEDPEFDSQWTDYLNQIASWAEDWGANLEAKLQPEKTVEEEEW